MLKEQFETAEFVAAHNVPTALAYDNEENAFVIGETALLLAETKYRPVVQNFKQAVGESDANFEGRPAAKGAKPQRLWEVRPDAFEHERFLSTREALRVFLRSLFESANGVPKQLIIGVPAVENESWLRQYRTHLTQVLTELGHPEPQFFPEPFAVFQYYRHHQKVIEVSDNPQAILVIDFGGGTFDSCVIETTKEGNLSRGGATAIPLGVKAVVGAGKAIDRKLLELAITKIRDPRLKQESVDARIAARPWVLLAAEDMKIALSRNMRDCRLEDDCRGFTEKRRFPAGWYHPDVAVELVLTGEDLQKTLRDLWMANSGFGATLLATVRQAKFRGGQVRLERLDKVILAGGSSALPFLRDLVRKTLSGQVEIRPEDIVIGSHCEQSVAYGIAIEAAEERNRALRTHNSLGPCVFDELFLYSAPRRREPAIKPKIRFWEKRRGDVLPPGTLLPGPMKVGQFEVEYLVELPFRPHGSLIYWFSSNEDEADPEANRLNIQQDIFRVPPKSSDSFRLKLKFDDKHGMISPEFTFGSETIVGAPFSFGGLRLRRDVREYAGIDFGTSNSYVVKLWGAITEKESKYPVFTISEAAGARLRAVEAKIEAARRDSILDPARAREYSLAEADDFIFHSIKIEGSSLTRGQTNAILSGEALPVSKDMQEPLNVREAYNFAIENAAFSNKTPINFIRELNKIVLRNISDKGGTYRTDSVSISGMEFRPPDPPDLDPFMEKLNQELKDGSASKSVIQRAAEIHSKLTSIHPFEDGNGRTARLLMNALLIDAGLPALVISYSDKQRYLDALASSNRGDISDLCNLLAELLEAALETLKGNKGQGAPEPNRMPILKKWVPSQELARIMDSRIARLPVDRDERYKAWLAAFGALREEFRSMCVGFNEAYGRHCYKAGIQDFDAIPFEKYEDLLRRKPASKTWFMGLDVQTDLKAERFVFWFHPMSQAFAKHSRAAFSKGTTLPPADVTSQFLDVWMASIVC